MSDYQAILPLALIGLFILSQVLYLLASAVDFYLYSLPVNWVDMSEVGLLGPGDHPYIVLFYPVLNELEETMRTTLTSLGALDYPRDRYRVVAIPNAGDTDTVASLERLQREFPFLQLMPVPPTSDASWQVVWDAWNGNDKAYWWHRGRRANIRDLPPKKTRQSSQGARIS